MEKLFVKFASIVGFLGAIAGSSVASASWFNQPKSPSMLVK